MKASFLLGLVVAWWLGVAGAAGAGPEPFLRLDEVGNYRVGYQRRGEAVVDLPVGWSGGLESPTGAACEPVGVHGGREAWLLHCPWKGATGVTFQEFTVELPRAPAVSLHGATALREDAVGKSDGVTCRVFVDGTKRYEANRQDAAWQEFDLDLSAAAGRSVTLRFEADPGPHDNASFDFSLWAGRRIEVPGFAPPRPVHPAGPLPDLARLVPWANGSVAPPSGFPGQTRVQVEGDTATFRYEGTDGALEYRWRPAADLALLGVVTLRARAAGTKPTETPLAGQARLEWIAPATVVSSQMVPISGDGADGLHAVAWQRTCLVGGEPATLNVTASLQNKSLVFDVACDRPVVRLLDGGNWGPAVRRRLVEIPYYSPPVQFLEKEDIFAGAFLDWTASRASSQNGTHAIYEPRTDGTRNLLHERIVYTAAWHLDETLPNVPNPPSSYRAELAKQVMLDVWGGSYASIGEKLHALAAAGSYGAPATLLLHEWQWGGYDNKLPQHVPALATLGGDAALTKLVQSAVADGIRVALHENYVDYYPNFPGYTERDVAREPDGSRVKAWLNEGTKIQSFGVKPTRILPLAQTQGPEVMRCYGTIACYLDVHSAVPPWFHVDADATQPGAGRFQTVWNVHRDLWAYERELHGGPVFGEGNNHWYWSGLLDGVEAQFGQGWPDGQGTAAPLLVNFDLLKIHPLQLNHGMGYYDRWWGGHGPDADYPLLALLDRYRMQEAAYGHQGFLGGDAWHDPGLAWLESHLLPPLTSRAALAAPVAIEYAADAAGQRWLGASGVVRERGDFSRVRIRYDTGLTVWANGSAQPWRVEETTLPPDGWLARGADATAGFSAGTTLRDGKISDHAETSDGVFANARAAVDWQARGTTRAQPGVADFAATNARSFRVSYGWKVGQALPKDLLCFVHFAPAADDPARETIRFQQDHRPALPTSRWQAGQSVVDGPWDVTLPGDLPPGDYRWYVGLHGAGEGRRLLPGRSDPHRRVWLGTLHVATDAPPSFTAAPSAGEAADPSLNAEPGVLNFGSIRTDGSVFVRREGADWVLRPFPADRPFVVELDAARFGVPPDARVENGWWRLPLDGRSSYRWSAER